MTFAALAASLLYTAAPAAASTTDEVVVQIREGDGAAGAALGELVIGNGAAEPPPIRMETPAEGDARLGAARQRCNAAKRPVAVFWLDVARPDEWRLYALPCAAQQPFVREIPVTSGEEQASIEALWLIVRSSAAAMAAGAEPAMEAVDPRALEPKPTEPTPPVREPTTRPPERPTPSPERVRKWSVRAGYAGDSLAPQIPWQSGVLAGFAYAPIRWLRIGAGYEFLAHARLDEPAGFALWRHAVALTIAGVAPLAKRVELEVRFAPELELSRWKSDVSGRGRLRAVPRLGLDALLQIELGRGVALELGPGLAVALIDVDFVTCATSATTCTGPGRNVVVDARRVRPRARAGISVRF